MNDEAICHNSWELIQQVENLINSEAINTYLECTYAFNQRILHLFLIHDLMTNFCNFKYLLLLWLPAISIIYTFMRLTE